MATASSGTVTKERGLGRWLALIAFTATGAWAGCTGIIGDGVEDGGTGPGVDPASVGSPDFRRLSPLEVEDTVVDMLAAFNISAEPDDLLLAAPDVRYLFSNTAESGHFTNSQVMNIMAWAESISALFVTDAEQVMGCTPLPSWDVCASDFATRVGRLAFRRPINEEDLARFRGVYENVAAEAEQTTDAVRALVEVALQSPEFWYLSNETRADSPNQLTSHAVAGRLSYYLWGTMPDATLREAADRDELQTPEQIRSQAARLLDDDRAEAVLARFHREWLHVSPATGLVKDTELYPSFTPELAADIDREFDMFVQRAVSEGTVVDLLASREGFVNERLESLYGMTSSTSGPEDWQWRSLGEERAGILARPLFLANTAGLGESALIHRGVAVIEDYLCLSLTPPDDVSEEAVELPPDATSGKLAGVENRAAKSQCASCHNTIDPIGMAFEVFDAVGAHRTEYPDGVAIDAGGELPPGFVDESVVYRSSAEMLAGLADLDQVQACYASKWLEWSTGRPPTGEQIAEVERLAVTGRVSIRDLLLEVATSPLLIQRGDI